jgi:hypothetical protein
VGGEGNLQTWANGLWNIKHCTLRSYTFATWQFFTVKPKAYLICKVRKCAREAQSVHLPQRVLYQNSRVSVPYVKTRLILRPLGWQISLWSHCKRQHGYLVRTPVVTPTLVTDVGTSWNRPPPCLPESFAFDSMWSVSYLSLTLSYCCM